MNPAVPVIVALLLLAILIFGRLWLQRINARACPDCYYPKEKCECLDKCKHLVAYPPRWSQDGWVAKCATCHDILYLGDDYDGGPKR